MKKAMMMFLALAMLAGLTTIAAAQTQAPPPPAYTKVTLTELHCMGCAKKIAKHVNTVSGVAEMRVDLNSKTIWAMHKQGMTPSPAQLWDAVEKADHTPTKMESPVGTYTAKPKS